jgi:hypothetical protein
MKYLKKWKLFESIDLSDFEIGISDDEIKDIFMEMIDINYEFDINRFYLTNNGSYFTSKTGINNFYPIISLRLHKYIDDNQGDSSNWDGSIYYEDRSDILDTLSDSVYRLRNMVGKSGKVSVAVRGINDINIRIVLPFKKIDDAISIDVIDDILVKLLEKYRGVNDNADFTNLINLYQTDLSGVTHLRSRSFDITPIFDRGPLNTEEPSTTGDFIISKMLTDNEVDNKSHLSSIFGIIIREFFENINKVYPGCKLKSIADRHNNKYEILSKDDTLILKIENYFEPIKEGYIALGKKSFFKKREKIFISIFKMDINIKYNRE